MKFIAGIAGVLLLTALLAPTFANARGSGSGSHGSPVEYRNDDLFT
jgi:hypothetical protein